MLWIPSAVCVAKDECFQTGNRKQGKTEQSRAHVYLISTTVQIYTTIKLQHLCWFAKNTHPKKFWSVVVMELISLSPVD